MAQALALSCQSLQRASHITQAVPGSFTAPKMQEIVTSSGKVLSLLRPDEDGKTQTIYSCEVFGVIRHMLPFRLVGGNRDYLIIGSDSGRLDILTWDQAKGKFIKVHEETYGKSGCRRVVPGQYLAVDPKGRALMVGAIEKQKLVYVLNRDTAANLTISSPLEAHKSHTLCYHMTGVDVGFENPIFATIEVDYEKKNEDKTAASANANALPPKMLTFYELDLGLNHVTRKWADKIDPNSNLLLTVPGDKDGPGGVLVCAENYIYYRNMEHRELKVPIPRRYGQPDDRGLLITSFAIHTQKNLFFFLVQSEFGDVYRITLDYDEDQVKEMHVKYFDTLAPTNSLCVLKSGLLFAASEFANHYLFQFQGIGDEDETPEGNTKSAAGQFVYFSPRPLTNLLLIDELDSLSPILDFKVADLAREHTPQIYALCGRGARSSVRVLRHGLAVSEMAVSELPGNPNAVWAVKKHANDPFCSYIVVSFVNATIVLSIGETVVEVNDSGILDSTPTLSVSLLGDNSLLQIHPSGIRHIRADKRINEWKTPGKKQIVRSAVNERQVTVGLTGGELVYFELDKSGALIDTHRKELGSEIASLALGPIPEGRLRSNFLAVGGLDNTVRILSLEAAQPMHQLTVQALPSQPTALSFVYLSGGVKRDAGTPNLYVYFGLQNGIVIRSLLDETSGALSDSRKRFLGTKPVKLFPIKTQKKPSVLALSSRSWLAYSHNARYYMTPLSYESLEHASAFSSEQCPEGIVCISGNTLRIVATERLGELFNQTQIPLRYTPRKALIHPLTNQLIVIESDHNAYSHKENLEIADALKQLTSDMQDEAARMRDGKDNKSDVKDVKSAGDEDPNAKKKTEFIYPSHAGDGKWGSCIRIIDPITKTTRFLLELEDNEAAFSLATVVFKGSEHELHLAVGTVKDMKLAPRSFSAAFIHIYKFGANHDSLTLLHKTQVNDVPLALVAYQNRLLAGVGKSLRLYELGRRKLLRKCENKNLPTTIATINVTGERIVVGDMCESFFFVRYKKVERQLVVVADSLAPRYVTSAAVLDYDTIAGGDKFGNVFVQRLPTDISAHINEDPTGYLAKTGQSAHKLSDVVQYHVGEMLTCLQKATLMPGGAEVLLYSTVLGGLGILLPFASKEDVDFFGHLEMHLRQENPPLAGRDHLTYRSYYFPVKDTVDIDLCEQFTTLEWERQQQIAEELICTPADVQKKLEELRNRVL